VEEAPWTWPKEQFADFSMKLHAKSYVKSVPIYKNSLLNRSWRSGGDPE